MFRKRTLPKLLLPIKLIKLRPLVWCDVLLGGILDMAWFCCWVESLWLNHFVVFLGWLVLWGCRKEFLRVCLGQNWLLGPRISSNFGVWLKLYPTQSGKILQDFRFEFPHSLKCFIIFISSGRWQASILGEGYFPLGWFLRFFKSVMPWPRCFFLTKRCVHFFLNQIGEWRRVRICICIPFKKSTKFMDIYIYNHIIYR